MICLYFRLYFIYTIRCTTLLPPFFFRNSRLYCKKLVIWFILWFKVLSIAGYRIFSYSMQIITEVTMPCEHLRYAIGTFPPPLHPLSVQLTKQRRMASKVLSSGVCLSLSPYMLHDPSDCPSPPRRRMTLILVYIFTRASATSSAGVIPARIMAAP